VGSLSDDAFLNTLEPIENYSPVASVHIEEGGVDHARRDGNSYTQLPESVTVNTRGPVQR